MSNKNDTPLLGIILVLALMIVGYFSLNFRVEEIIGTDANFLETLYYRWLYGLNK